MKEINYWTMDNDEAMMRISDVYRNSLENAIVNNFGLLITVYDEKFRGVGASYNIEKLSIEYNLLVFGGVGISNIHKNHVRIGSKPHWIEEHSKKLLVNKTILFDGYIQDLRLLKEELIRTGYEDVVVIGFINNLIR